MRPSLLFSVSFLFPCFFLYLLGSFEVTVTSVSLPPFVSRRGLSNTIQRLSLLVRGRSYGHFILPHSVYVASRDFQRHAFLRAIVSTSRRIHGELLRPLYILL